MAAGYETPQETSTGSNIAGKHIGNIISNVLAAKVIADKERAYAQKQAYKQGIDEAEFNAMNPRGFFFRKALIGQFGGFAVKKKKQELAALYRKGLMLGKITKNKRLRGKVIGQLKESLIYSKANLKNAKKFRSQFDYTNYDEYFAPQSEKVPSTRKKVQNAIGGEKGKRVSREQIIESIDAIAKSIEKTAQSITQSSASVYGTLITANQLQADVAQDLKVRNTTLEDKLQKLVDVISNQTQVQKDFIDKKEDIQQEAQLERKTISAASQISDDLTTTINESRTYSTFANEQEMMDPYLRQPPQVKPVNSIVNDTASMEAYGYPKAEKGGTFTGGGLELHGTEALASNSGIQIVSGPDSGYLHKIKEPTKVYPLDNNYTQGEPSAVDGKVRPKPKTSMINNIQKFELGTKNNFNTTNSNIKKFEIGTDNLYKPAKFNINTDASQPLVDAMSLPMMAAGGGILASTSNYINSMGAAGQEIQPELKNVTRSVADVFGLPSTIATKATGTRTFPKPKEEIEKPEEKDDKKSLFEKMKEGFGKFMELLGKKINESGDGNGGNGGGGGGGDGMSAGSTGERNAAAFLSTLEGGSGQTAADTMQVMLNRAANAQAGGAMSSYGTSLFDQITAREQFSPFSAAIYGGSADSAAAQKYGHITKALGSTPEQRKKRLLEIADGPNGLVNLQKLFNAGSAGAAASVLKDFESNGAMAQSARQFVGQSMSFRGYDTAGSRRRAEGGNYIFGGGAHTGMLDKVSKAVVKPTTPIAGNPPGALANGQRPDLALSDSQYKAQQKAIKEADAMGLTGKERAKYIADKVMAVPSPIFDRPSQQSQATTINEISANPRQNNKTQIITLNTSSGSKLPTAGSAKLPTAADSTVAKSINPLQNSGLYLG